MDATKSFVEIQNEDPDRQEDTTKPTRQRRIYDDKQRCTMFVFFILASISIPIIIYFITINVTVEPNIEYSCSVDDSYKIPCGRINISGLECIQINCCYDDSKLSCYHFIPSKYNYHYNEDGKTFNSLLSFSPLGNRTIPQLKLTIVEVDSNKVKVILHTPSVSYTPSTVENKTYVVKQDDRFLGVDIFRQSTEHMLLSTLRGPLIASNHYWEWTVHLLHDKLFGLGELVLPKNKTLTKVIYKSRNDHTTLPNFICYLNGSFYGILIEHDGPLEVTIFPSGIVILKSLAGNRVAINVYTGPSPKDVIQQIRSNNSLSTPYWALGAHICRDGNATLENALNEFVQFQTEKNIHYASDCIHENLYNILYQNYDQYLTDLIDSLQENKTRFFMSIPPQILKLNKYLYDAAVELNIIYKNNDGENLHLTYQNQEAVFADYSHTSIGIWFDAVKSYLPTNRIDGFVLKDNWPDEDKYIFKDPSYEFPYMTDTLNQSLSKTLPWNATSFSISPQPHILHHNSYGNAQVFAFQNYMQYEFLLTSSYDSGISESILVQNVNISWIDLKKALTTTLYNGMFGNSFISYPVCGSTSFYNNKTNDELCLRWYMVSATLPLFRISSDFPRRDPSHLVSGYTKNFVEDAIKKRYMLLPYYYTTLSTGEPLVRPMMYKFHQNNATWDLDEQYMLGDALLVAQPLLPALTILNIYLPPEVKVWYEFWGGNPYNKTGWTTLNVVKSDWVMFIAEGSIIPVRHHKSALIGEYSSEDSFSFAVALNCSSAPCFAKGLLQLDTVQLSFTANDTGILMTNILEAQNDIKCDVLEPNQPKYVDAITIYGLSNIVVKSTFLPIDLCNVTEEVLYIPYVLI